MIVSSLAILILGTICSAAKGLPRTDLDYGIYHRVDDLVKELMAIVEKNPTTMKFEELRATDNGYSASLMVITSEQGGISNNHHNKLRVLMSFGEHGREVISAEVGLKFITLLQDRAKLRELMGSDESSNNVSSLLDQMVFKIFPVENMNGRRLVEGGELCERKNGRGVDPNRNWDIDFGVKEADYDPREEYPGDHAFSEPEVQMILKVAQDFLPHVWINIHSGMEAMFMPYDHLGNIPIGSNALKQLELLKTLQQIVCSRCVVGSGGKSVGYLAHGTATDYMYEKLHVPLSFTWEIYGDETASFEDCFKMFNPTTPSSFENVTRQWSKGLFQLIELLPSQPVLSRIFATGATELRIQKNPYILPSTVGFDYTSYGTLLLMIGVAISALILRNRGGQAFASR